MRKPHLTGRPALANLAAIAIAIVPLAACQKANAPPALDAGTSAKAVPAPGLTLVDGRLVLSAVTGNPAAAYFTLTNGGAAASVTGVAVDGASKAEMHETMGTEMKPLERLDIAAGASVGFAPGGKHVMVFGLKPGLAAGAATKITLTLAGGGTLTGTLKVEAAGGVMGPMPGM